jgi:hypothetical protein
MEFREWIIQEELLALMRQDESGLASRFIDKLSSYIPGGLKRLPAQIANSVKGYLGFNEKPDETIRVSELPNEPSETDVQQIMARTRTSQTADMVKYYAGIFNKRLKSHVATEAMPASAYYSQLSNFLTNPSKGLGATDMLTVPKDQTMALLKNPMEPSPNRRLPQGFASKTDMEAPSSASPVIDAAYVMMTYTQDPNVRTAVIKAIKEMFEDQEFRQSLAMLDRRKKAEFEEFCRKNGIHHSFVSDYLRKTSAGKEIRSLKRKLAKPNTNNMATPASVMRNEPASTNTVFQSA